MTGWRLLLTRPADECKVLAGMLAEQGIHSSSLPLLAIEPLVETPEQRSLIMELDRYPAVIAISKPAARLGLELLDRYWPQPPYRQVWFTPGAASGAILADYGLAVCWPEDGDDSESLLEMPHLAEALAQPDPRVLLIKGEGGRELLADTLRARGVQVDTLILYRRRLPEYPSDILLQTIQAERLNGLAISSGQGLQYLQELAASTWPVLNRLTFFVPSSRVADMARQKGVGNVVACRGAGTPALLAALRETPVPAVS